MKHINLFLMLCVLCIVVYGISACSKEENHKPDTDQSIPTPEPDPTPEPEPDNYTLQGTMQAAEQLVGKIILRFISICALTAGIILNTPIHLTKITMTVYIVRLYTTNHTTICF